MYPNYLQNWLGLSLLIFLIQLLSFPLLWLHANLGPVSLTVFPSQFKFDGNFVSLTSILMQWLLQNFVRSTTAVLSWHVQKFVAIWWPVTELWQGEVSIEFELRAKKTLVKWDPDWPLQLREAAAIRTLDPLVHLYLVISEELKRANFSLWKLSTYQARVIPDKCVVRLF